MVVIEMPRGFGGFGIFVFIRSNEFVKPIFRPSPIGVDGGFIGVICGVDAVDILFLSAVLSTVSGDADVFAAAAVVVTIGVSISTHERSSERPLRNDLRNLSTKRI